MVVKFFPFGKKLPVCIVTDNVIYLNWDPLAISTANNANACYFISPFINFTFSLLFPSISFQSYYFQMPSESKALIGWVRIDMKTLLIIWLPGTSFSRSRSSTAKYSPMGSTLRLPSKCGVQKWQNWPLQKRIIFLWPSFMGLRDKKLTKHDYKVHSP